MLLYISSVENSQEVTVYAQINIDIGYFAMHKLKQSKCEKRNGYISSQRNTYTVLSIRKERHIWQNLNAMLYYVTFWEDSLWQIKYNDHIFGKCVQIADNSFFFQYIKPIYLPLMRKITEDTNFKEINIVKVI